MLIENWIRRIVKQAGSGEKQNYMYVAIFAALLGFAITPSGGLITYLICIAIYQRLPKGW